MRASYSGTAGTQICPRELQDLHSLLQGNSDPRHSCGRWERGGEWRKCEHNIGHRYLRLPCLPEIPSLECGTSGFGWLEGCGVRAWRIGPRRPELFSPTGSSGSSLPRSAETGRPPDANTQSPCLDRPVAPTRGQYLRGSRSQSPWALGVSRASGLLGHRTPCSRVKTSSWSIESKGSHSHSEPKKVQDSRTFPSFSLREARLSTNTQRFLKATDQLAH